MGSNIGAALVAAAFRLRKRPLLWMAFLLVALAACVGSASVALSQQRLSPSLPYRDPDDLVFAWSIARDGSGQTHGQLSANAVDVLSRNASVSDWSVLETWQGNPGSLFRFAGPEGAQSIRVARVSQNFFRLLGVDLIFGLDFASSDEGDQAVLGEDFWRTSFQGDPTVIGRSLRVAGGVPWGERIVTVRGVAPRTADFSSTLPTQLWISLPKTEPSSTELARFRLLVRLKQDASRRVVAQQFTAKFQDRLRSKGVDESESRLREIRLESVREHLIEDRRAFLELSRLCGVLLLCACLLSIAVMSTMNAHGRASEFALRQFQGATVRDVGAMLAAEAGARGVAMLALMLAAAPVLTHLLAVWIVPPAAQIETPSTVMGVVIVASAWAVIAAVTSWASGRIVLVTTESPLTRLSVGGRGILGSDRTRRVRVAGLSILVAMLLLLLVSVGALRTTVKAMSTIEMGFDAQGLIAVDIPLMGVNAPDESWFVTTQNRLLEKVRELPMVGEAAITSDLPLERTGRSERYVRRLDGRGPRRVVAAVRVVDPAFFSMLGIRIVKGQFFDRNVGGPRKSVVIDRSLATVLFGDEDPIGRSFETLRDVECTIVGVIEPVRYDSIFSAPMPVVYFSSLERGWASLKLVVRPAGHDGQLAKEIESALRATAPALSVGLVTNLGALSSRPLVDVALAMGLLLVLAAASATVSATAIGYAVMSDVSCRRSEIGLRRALGASHRRVAWVFLKGPVKALAIGGLVGLTTAGLSWGVVSSILYEASVLDAHVVGPAFVTIIVLFIVAGLPAAVLALRIPPSDALRES